MAEKRDEAATPENEAAEEILGEALPEEVPGEETPVEAPGAEEAEEATAPETFEQTTDENPDLSGKAVGDEVTYRIESISDDGNTFTLSPMAEAGIPGEGAGADEGAAGRSSVRDTLLNIT